MSSRSHNVLAEASRILADYEQAVSVDNALLSAYPDHPGFSLLTGDQEMSCGDRANVERILAACGNDALVRLFQIRAERDGSPLEELEPGLRSALDEALAERRTFGSANTSPGRSADPEELDVRQRNLLRSIVDALDGEGLLGDEPGERA